ncbi:hypothetical protein Ciccas_005860 [Cichlidogyrus casuarinus]|uniref:Uncharacterized protein n=1 Tax=Cichlidogyrus casuarinus TaxID=1844966 RepID=A0ABD2Q7F7_9PLAT
MYRLILSVFEDLCEQPTANETSGYLQDLGPEILPELLTPGTEGISNKELVEDLFSTAPGLVKPRPGTAEKFALRLARLLAFTKV